MSDAKEFRLPDVGEGLTEAEIVNWLVEVGDEVQINDTLVEIETAKSVVELPSPFAGFVTAILTPEGATVEVGTAIIAIGGDDAETNAADAGSVLAAMDRPVDPASGSPGGSVEDDKPQVLVGPGPKPDADRRRRLAPRPTAPAERVGAPVVRSDPAPAGVLAKPPVRLLAKQLGVDLAAVTPGPDGRISRTLVEALATATATDLTQRTSGESRADCRETRVPIKGVRKAIADAMVSSAFTAPHVTEWVTVDVTATMNMVRRLKTDPLWRDVRINPLVFVARAYLLAIRSYPDVNASWDDQANEIVVKNYVNLGIAAATPRGLIVPNIKDADGMDLRQLAQALQVLVETARAGKTQPAEMSAGTVTITNIGALGVDAGTPILNPGESAILAFGAVRRTPWVVGDEIVIREVTQLAMSFDHRLVDGELGSNVLVRTGELLADPGTALLHL